MEEVDVLRVEHANDITVIQELRMCLEDEKRGSIIQLWTSSLMCLQRIGICLDSLRTAQEVCCWIFS